MCGAAWTCPKGRRPRLESGPRSHSGVSCVSESVSCSTRSGPGGSLRRRSRAAAEVKNNPPDLMNVALELLVKASLELPGFSTLNEMTSRIRGEVNTALFERILGRMPLADAL